MYKKRIDLFWERFCERVFIPEVQAFAGVLNERVLKRFEKVDQEAESIERNAYSELASSLDTEEYDQVQIAEWAFDRGLSHYQMLVGLRQGIINLFTVGLYHLFEQHIFILYRKELLHPAEEDDKSKFKWNDLKGCFKGFGIPLTSVGRFDKIEELRLLANCIKHAAGSSCEKLARQRPDLFTNPELDKLFNLPSTFKVSKPLMGDDIYVTVPAFNEYAGAIIQFWSDFWQAVRRQHYGE